MQAKFTELGAKDIDISIENTASGFTAQIDRKMPADVPSAMKSFLGEWNQVTQKESWTGAPDSGFECQMQVEIEGVPVSINGKMKITASGILTTNEIEMQISCGIPLFGGQVESFVASNIEKSMADEFAFIKAHLG